jgi:hypothetical protein
LDLDPKLSENSDLDLKRIYFGSTTLAIILKGTNKAKDLKGLSSEMDAKLSLHESIAIPLKRHCRHNYEILYAIILLDSPFNSSKCPFRRKGEGFATNDYYNTFLIGDEERPHLSRCLGSLSFG